MDTDFLGFRFAGVHFYPYATDAEVANKSAVRILRTSDNGRYQDELLPQSQDVAVTTPGGDGTYYFGTNYVQKSWNISFAFDNLTEEDIRLMRQTFAKRDALFPLIFDEAPYKFWMAKA